MGMNIKLPILIAELGVNMNIQHTHHSLNS